MKNLIKFISGIHRQIAHIERFNTTPLAIKETVAEHSYFVAHYARLIADYLEQEGYKVDKLKVVDMALVHDNEECWSGDVVYMVKRENKNIAKAMANIAKSAIKKVFKDLDKIIKNYWLECWNEWHSKQTLEKQIVLLADILSLWTYLLEQIKMGNQYVKPAIQRVICRLEKFVKIRPWAKEIYKEIIKEKYTNKIIKEKNIEEGLYNKNYWDDIE